MHKDDLVIGLTKNVIPCDNQIPYHTPGYAACISTLGEVNVPQLRLNQAATAEHMSGMTDFAFINDRDHILTEANRRCTASDPSWVAIASNQFQPLPGFYFLGVALTTGYAHPSSGDTVCSVMVSGLRTIRNGPFQINTNDTLQWIWDVERMLYDKETGEKLQTIVQGIESLLESKKRSFAAMNSGTYSADRMGGKANAGKKNIAVIKPFRIALAQETLRSRVLHAYDHSRIIGRAMSNAQPYEMVDILVSSQSM